MKKEQVRCSICGQKTMFPELKKDDCVKLEHYAKYCPEAENLVEKEVNGVIQHCPNCGYVFLRIDEKTKTGKELVVSKEYVKPFGENYHGPKEAVECFQLAVTYQNMDCKRLAVQWYIYGAILLKEYEYVMARRTCLKNALFLLEQILKTADLKKEIEIYLAYLNVMRMLGLFDLVMEYGSEILDKCQGLDKRLVATIMRQASLKCTDYLTYIDMLFLEVFGNLN